MKTNKLALLGGKPIKNKPFERYDLIGEEEKKAVLNVFEKKIPLSGFHGTDDPRFLGGEFVRIFEKNFSKYFDVKNSVGFNSATTALQAAIIACGIGPGDEVITSPLSMSATPASILMSGAIPVFADVDPLTSNISPKSIRQKINKKTKAILVVNLFGGSCDYDAILSIAKKNKLKVIEDNAQGIGSKYKNKYLGTIGDVGIFSFNVHKILQAGEGGVLVTNNDDIAYKAQLVRNHGEVIVDQRYQQGEPYEPIIGSNYRLTEIHAAIANAQLTKIDKIVPQRIQLAEYLTKKLSKFAWLKTPYLIPNSVHVYFLYPLLFDSSKIGISRETFVKAMTAEGFPLSAGYSQPLYLQKLYQERKMFPNSRFPFTYNGEESNVSYEKGICPEAEKLSNETQIIVNTIHHYMPTKKDIDSFISAIDKIVANVKDLQKYERRN